MNKILTAAASALIAASASASAWWGNLVSSVSPMSSSVTVRLTETSMSMNASANTRASAADMAGRQTGLL